MISIQFPFVAVFELCKKWLFAQGLVKVLTWIAMITGPLVRTYLPVPLALPALMRASLRRALASCFS